MEKLLSILNNGPVSLATLALALLAVGGVSMAWPLVANGRSRNDLKRRLKVDGVATVGSMAAEEKKPDAVKALRQKAEKTAQDFYSKADAESVVRIRMQLLQAGYMDPGAVGKFFLARIVSFFVFSIATFAYLEFQSGNGAGASRLMFVLAAGAFGYFFPSLFLAQRARAKRFEHRNGFPDFMDLMIVCSDAGMSMEASIERVSREIALSYPSLSENLRLVSIELRAGRSLDDTLKALAERLGLDEVRAFATLLQQSKELGTSLSGALRIFSDEMRNKRMSMAEEKAHALPAKMSVPVTVCILPVVIMIAIIPLLTRYLSGE
ncbi:MAG: type II secretion system F family protein [Rhizobiaceae bacterium]